MQKILIFISLISVINCLNLLPQNSFSLENTGNFLPKSMIDQLKHLDKLELLDQLKHLSKLTSVSKLNMLDKLSLLEHLNMLDKLSLLEQLNMLDKLSLLEQLNMLDKLSLLEQLNMLDKLSLLEQLNKLDKLSLLEQLNKLDKLSLLEQLNKLDNITSFIELLNPQQLIKNLTQKFTIIDSIPDISQQIFLLQNSIKDIYKFTNITSFVQPLKNLHNITQHIEKVFSNFQQILKTSLEDKFNLNVLHNITNVFDKIDVYKDEFFNFSKIIKYIVKFYNGFKNLWNEYSIIIMIVLSIFLLTYLSILILSIINTFFLIKTVNHSY